MSTDEKAETGGENRVEAGFLRKAEVEPGHRSEVMYVCNDVISITRRSMLLRESARTYTVRVLDGHRQCD